MARPKGDSPGKDLPPLLCSLLRSGILSPEDKLLICRNFAHSFSVSRDQVTQRVRIARAGSAREDQILPVRDKCGAQRHAVHELLLRLCDATFSSPGPIYALASTHYFAVCLSCSRDLSTRWCHHIKSFLNRPPSHLVNVRQFWQNFLLPGTPPFLLKYLCTAVGPTEQARPWQGTVSQSVFINEDIYRIK